MKLKHYFATLVFVFLATSVFADERVYKAVDEFTHALPANPDRQISIAEGDLNGDGLSDRAVLTDEGDARSHRLYVLVQTRDGGFRVAQESKQNDGLWQAVYLSIEKGSLFVNIEGMRPTSGARHQFKFYRGIWRLIGLRYTGVTGHAADGGVAAEGYDWNVLTGDVAFNNENGGKSSKRGKWVTAVCRLDGYNFEPEFCTADAHSGKSR